MTAEDTETELAALRRDLAQAQAEQAAAAGILNAIKSATLDLEDILVRLIRAAIELCGAARGVIWIRQDDVLVLGAHVGYPPEWVDMARANPILPAADSHTVTGRVAHSGEVSNVDDLPNDPRFSAYAAHRLGDYRGSLAAPLIRDGRVTGVIGLTRPTPGFFSERQVALIQRFADQAVIAIENARLVAQLDGRTRDLKEALDVQTATADVLKVISRSVFDLDAVLGTLIDTAVRLCHGSRGTIFLRNGDLIEARAFHSNVPQALRDYILAHPRTVDADHFLATTVREARIVHFGNLEAERSPIPEAERALASFGSLLCVPLIRDGMAIGCFGVPRDRPDPFTEREIELVKTFADQAVIAIENARLFGEVQARTGDLQVALDQQTVIAGALSLISRSVTDLPQVLAALIRSAAELCRADCGVLWLYDEEAGELSVGSQFGYRADFEPILRSTRIRPGPDSTYLAGRAAAFGEIVATPDVQQDSRFSVNPNHSHAGYRSVLAVPLLRDGTLLGVFGLDAYERGAFGEREVELVKTFADQAVIAMHNARLFDKVEQRTRELAASLDELRAAQDRLVQTEKLASLGQLTAGIAHEIKNPLNFVNNFASLSSELVDELVEVLASSPLQDDVRAQVDEIAGLIKGNLDKVTSHGRRADSIVKNMLLHSRSGTGERRPVEVNALVEESLTLAYHGARAEIPGFNVTLRRDYDPGAGESELFPQEITRVLLNLIGNGFYAVRKRAETGEAGYEPAVTLATRGTPEGVEIRVLDNGTGIPDHVRQKMFDPFFTTKPAGEGTGLGLSLSHDIVVKQHKGGLSVDTRAGDFTQFTITLPRKAAAGGHGGTA